MKKVYFLILLVMFSVLNVSAKEGVSITDIQCSNMTNGKVKENMDVKVNGLNIDVEDTKFGTVGDYMKCTLEVTNDSDDSVSVNETSISNLSNDYIQYELLSDSKEIKKGEKAKYNLNINYKKEYEEDKTIDNVVKLELVSDDMKNPSTSSTNVVFIGFLLVVLILVGMMVIHKNQKLKMMVLLLILGVLTIPSVMALTSVKITLNNKIIVETEKYHVYYMVTSFLTEEEKSNYIFTDVSECREKPAYFKDDPSKTAYFMCYGLLKDAGTYKPGTRVNLIGLEYLWGYTTDYGDYISCPTKDIDISDFWDYEKKYNKDYQDSDIAVMNFENVRFNNWEGYYGYVGLSVPNSFNMPSHDVYFSPHLAK